MSTRAAVNILGSTGELLDVVSMGCDTISTSHPGVGVYRIHGTLGMAPPPLGWGYVVNPVDAEAVIDIEFADAVLTVNVFVGGVAADLRHSITLHVAVEEAAVPAVVQASDDKADDLDRAQQRYQALRARADYTIAPLQDAVDIGAANDDVKARLLAWKHFRLALSEVSAQAHYPHIVDWPITPD